MLVSSQKAFWSLLRVLVLALWMVPSSAATQPVVVLTLRGAIGPATADYVTRGIQQGATAGAQLVVLRLDTPGGLDAAMRAIIKGILASPVPVATYVSPGGARAASAGTFILYASHIAAMTPGTNLGAASPVAIGVPGIGEAPQKPEALGAARDVMGEKAMNDAAAYIRSLAQLRGRNVEWAEKAVRSAQSLSASEALRLGVIDYVADDLTHLLRLVDGRRIRMTNGKEVVLATARASIISQEAGWRTNLLSVITAPGVALILMMIGVYGLFFEFANPGFVAPGVIGAISLLLGLYALQQLPVNYVGLALILLGIAFMVAEAFVPSFGILGLGGVAAFVFGAVILIDTEKSGYAIPVSLIVALGVVSAAVIATIAGMMLKARRRPIVSGSEELIGSTGEVIQCEAGRCWAHVRSELWQVHSAVSLVPGQRIRVTGRDGLVLAVMPMTASSDD